MGAPDEAEVFTSLLPLEGGAGGGEPKCNRDITRESKEAKRLEPIFRMLDISVPFLLRFQAEGFGKGKTENREPRESKPEAAEGPEPGTSSAPGG
jgi:hypothetical protein